MLDSHGRLDMLGQFIMKGVNMAQGNEKDMLGA